MRVIVRALEALGYMWAYRVIDARAFGLPQRRRRVLIVASRSEDPRDVLFGEDHGQEVSAIRNDSGRGFYWTEGRTGLGWAIGAIPTLKGGSGIGIASPPAIWFPARRTVELPTIRDAERLQGFEPDWTLPAERAHGRGARWRLVGNAVCVPMMEWLAEQLRRPSKYSPRLDIDCDSRSGWPNAAWGRAGHTRAHPASAWPTWVPSQTINSFLRYETKPLSFRATDGFLRRAQSSGLTFEAGFLADVAHHRANMRSAERRCVRNRRSE